ncbi:MAG: HAMP domain-containing sensor histidine kinase [Peptococcaceae bacterium]|nr:HAMP domain-containing sensor histidine kinase [Peptococcaceae bacterium]
MFIATAILLVLVVFKYVQLKQQIRHITKQIQDLTVDVSEKMVDISLIDKDLEALAGVLNRYNDKQRRAVAAVMHHEKMLQEAVANISHDLRTPLTVILGHLQLLRQEPLTTSQQQRVDVLHNKATQMAGLVQEFYDLSIIETKDMVPLRERLNLTNVLINLVSEQAPAFEAKGLQPRVVLPDHSVYLYSDERMIERILQNLVTNAIRYSTGEVKISLSQKDAGSVVFTIENAIEPSLAIDASRLFDRFYTADQSRQHGGTGVGLAVVKALTEKLGGRVTAQCDQEKLTIVVELK